MKSARIFTFIVCMFFSVCLLAQNNYTKPVKKTFRISPNSILKIGNEYGNIRILQTKTDSITINATISVSHYDSKTAEKQLDEITIVFGNINNVVSARTEISKNFKTGYKFSIDYIVSIPEGVKLEVSNSFGDIIAEGDIKNLAEFSINYGNIYVDNLIPYTENDINYFKMNYSTAHLKNINNSKILSNFSKIRISKANEVIVSSRCSRIELDKAFVYSCNTQNDKNIIKDCPSVIINRGENSHITIENNITDADINLRGGSLTINNAINFNKLAITTEKTTVNIDVAEKANYYIKTDFTETQYKLPKNIHIQSKKKDEFNKTEEIQAICGEKDAIINSLLQIKAKNGFVTIK